MSKSIHGQLVELCNWITDFEDDPEELQAEFDELAELIKALPPDDESIIGVRAKAIDCEWRGQSEAAIGFRRTEIRRRKCFDKSSMKRTLPSGSRAECSMVM